MIKRLVKSALSELGYEVHKKGKFGIGLFHPSYLSRICQPRTVIDVGVGRGTYSLYEAFPKSHFILIEPLKEYEDAISKILAKYEGDVHYKAAGDTEGLLKINVDKSNLHQSSFFDRINSNGKVLERRFVETTTLDTIYQQSDSMECPVLLKIDTEGNELSVLKGSELLLQITDMVIVEVSIATRFENSYEFGDLVSWMDKNGFSLFSIIHIAHYETEIRPRYVDVVFKRCNRLELDYERNFSQVFYRTRDIEAITIDA